MRYLPDAKQMKTADSFTINELKIPSLDLWNGLPEHV